MLATVFSGAVMGVDAYQIEIEVNAASMGDPQIVVVGLPDVAVKESKDRVFTAMVNSGFRPHLGRTTVNLAPAHIKKEGPSFDLPIAVGMVAAQGLVEPDTLLDTSLVGELALSGAVRRVRGVLPIALQARAAGLKRLLVPLENAEEAAVVKGLEVYPVGNLREAVDFLDGGFEIPPFDVDAEALFSGREQVGADFADIKGQEHARRAIEVAVSGGHNLLMIGPPGSGKTMIARRIPSILPELVLEEALETTRIHSIAGTLSPHEALVSTRPFRAPHHTISDAGLLGGGTHPVPGEVSLAHRGVLFLDELPEFRRNVLEVLRQPLEDGQVTIARAAMTVTFPCEFMLVAAMNPCPCGFYTDPKRECRCTQKKISAYRNKISGPLLDRIDIHIEVPAVTFGDLSGLGAGESSASIRERAVEARHRQRSRFKGYGHVRCNADMRACDVQKFCRMESAALDLLRLAMSDMQLSARAYDRILKVSRTIADLADVEQIGLPHISEAIQYRTLDRQLWI